MAKDVKDMTRDELLGASRASESRLNVLQANASRSPDTYQKQLDEARQDHVAITTRLKELDSDPKPVADPEGTAPNLADAQGNFASNADVANKGGIGIDDSNTNPGRGEEERQKELEDAAAAREAEAAETQTKSSKKK